MSSRRGRNRNSTATADRREDDSKGSPEPSSGSQPEIPLSYEYETEDGLVVEITPTSAGISREYQLSESDYIEFSAEAEWSLIDVDISRDGRNTDISGEVGIPGDILGIGGGVEVDLATGEITGGEVSAEALGVGLDVEVSDRGCIISVGLSVGGIGATYTKDICEDEEEPEEKDEKEDDGESAEGVNDDILGPGGELDGWGAYEDDLPPGCRLTLQYFTQFTAYKKIIASGATAMSITIWIKRKAGLSSSYPNGTFAWPDGGTGVDVNSFSGNAWSKIYDRDLPYYMVDGSHLISGSPARVKEKMQNEKRPYALGGAYIVGCRDKIPRGPKKKDDNDKKKPPGKPPMRERDCCSASTKMIREIHEALNAREILDNHLIVPNRLVAPNAKGAAKLKSYLDIAQWQMRMMDHLGLHPFKSSLSDANAAQAGNQKVEIQFASGTAALNKIVELLLENKGDSASRLNLQVRSALIQAQILQVASICAKTLEAIGNFLGMPLQEKISWVKMPFDVSLGARKKQKGFDPKQQQAKTVEQISINTEAATEEILPELLKEGSQPITHPKFTGKGVPSLMELIRGIKFDE